MTSYNQLVSEILASSNNMEVRPESLLENFSAHQKIFQLTDSTKHVRLVLKYLPVEILAAKEVRNIKNPTKATLDSVIATYGNVFYFNLKILGLQGSDIYTQLHEQNSSDALNMFLFNEYFQNIKLDGKHYPSVYNYDNTKGVFPGFSFLIGFDSLLFSKDSSIDISENLLSDSVSFKLKPFALLSKNIIK